MRSSFFAGSTEQIIDAGLRNIGGLQLPALLSGPGDRSFRGTIVLWLVSQPLPPPTVLKTHETQSMTLSAPLRISRTYSSPRSHEDSSLCGEQSRNAKEPSFLDLKLESILIAILGTHASSLSQANDSHKIPHENYRVSTAQKEESRVCP